jgi:hypothetical protein
MLFNPLVDVLVETGYLGYSLRCIAHRQPGGTFTASLLVREGDARTGSILREGGVPHWFSHADAAIDRAMREGHRVVEERLDSLKARESKLKSSRAI